MFSVVDQRVCKGSKHKLPCGAKVYITRTEAGRELAVNLKETSDGNTAVWKDVFGVLRSRRIPKNGRIVPPQRRMTPHIDTCAGKPRVTPPPRPPRPPKPERSDLYVVLGVAKDASQADVRRAYRRHARQMHPDVNPDPAVAAKFQDIGEAYHVLGDPGRRAAYDRTGSAPRPK